MRIDKLDENIGTFFFVSYFVVEQSKYKPKTLEHRCIVIVVVCCRQGESAGVLGAVAVH